MKATMRRFVSFGLFVKGLTAYRHAVAFVSILIIFLFGFLPSPARATAIYEYTGNPFDSSLSLNGGYGGTSVSGQFSLSTPLAPNTALTDISGSILSFSFTDGVNTITNMTLPLATYSFKVGTDATGNINDWELFVSQDYPSPAMVGSQFFQIGTAAGYNDYGFVFTCTTVTGTSCTDSVDKGEFTDSDGTWSVTVAPVLEPSSLYLLVVGLAVFAGWGRRKTARQR
jgi:hypothetical protein